jgi:hypothetical protein
VCAARRSTTPSHLDRDQSGLCRRAISQLITRTHCKEQPMLDVILLALGLGFFALSIAYAFGCDSL